MTRLRREEWEDVCTGCGLSEDDCICAEGDDDEDDDDLTDEEAIDEEEDDDLDFLED